MHPGSLPLNRAAAWAAFSNTKLDVVKMGSPWEPSLVRNWPVRMARVSMWSGSFSEKSEKSCVMFSSLLRPTHQQPARAGSAGVVQIDTLVVQQLQRALFLLGILAPHSLQAVQIGRVDVAGD